MAEETHDHENDPSEEPPMDMGHMLGLLRIHIKRGINLAVRDVRTSDPYVVVKMGKQVSSSCCSYSSSVCSIISSSSSKF